MGAGSNNSYFSLFALADNLRAARAPYIESDVRCSHTISIWTYFESRGEEKRDGDGGPDGRRRSVATWPF